MNRNTVYVGIDVDDVRYHGCALNPGTGEMLEFQCLPTLKGLVGQLDKLQEYFGEAQLKLCYEASYVGFSLQRDLQSRGCDCAVVAPSSIPRRAGKSVKTDRIDAAELAEFYANGLLTIVAAPAAELEQDRDLLRSRQQLKQQQGALRGHIQSLLRRNGLHYKAETQHKTLWQTHHYGWLDRTLEGCSGSLKVVGKDMAQVAITMGAAHFRAYHAVTGVAQFIHIRRGNRLAEAGPAAAGVKFV